MYTRKNLHVCEHCLMAIESREGTLLTKVHYTDEVDEIDDANSKCDWCEDTGFTKLYELL